MATVGLDLFDVDIFLAKGEVITFNDDDTRFVVVDEKTKTNGVFVMREQDLPPSYVLDGLTGCWLEVD